jgi:ATP-dependent DNA helicase RecG
MNNLLTLPVQIKKVLANGHYELKEYTIDAIEGEGEHSTMLARKPHPIYPSKAGLKPSLLGLSISRSVHGVSCLSFVYLL